jgi:hypothetical protein
MPVSGIRFAYGQMLSTSLTQQAGNEMILDCRQAWIMAL